MKSLDRLKFLKIVVCLGLIGGILLSFELWFPVDRTFPRAPLLFELRAYSVEAAERFLTIILIISLVATVFFGRRKIFPAAVIASLAALIFFDQTRLQPWIYQYLMLLLVVAALSDAPPSGDEEASTQTLALAQVVIAALYFWSGVQKLNYSFSHETLPALLSPLRNISPIISPPYIRLGITVALVEIFIGGGLLYGKTRNPAVCLAVGTHLAILGLLIAQNYNHVVWGWNVALGFLVIGAFWRSDISFGAAIEKAAGWKAKTAGIIVAASILLPILSFFGWWDVYLSGALYSGRTEIAVVRVNDAAFEKLPPKARAVVFQTKTGGEKMLPLFEWAIAETNVPVYPERRVFRAVARNVCRLADDKTGVELIIKECPAILDGSFQITRVNCAELEK